MLNCINKCIVTIAFIPCRANISVSVDLLFPSVNSTKGAFIGVRVNNGGCYTFESQGVYVFMLLHDQLIVISGDLGKTASLSQLTIISIFPGGKLADLTNFKHFQSNVCHQRSM